MFCFRMRFGLVHRKFEQIERLVGQGTVTVDREEYEALKSELQVVSRQNIDDMEKRVNAMWRQCRAQTGDPL